jgi:hypothetical protein
MADAIYEVEAPDGTRFKFSGPEGASQADIQAFAQQQFKALSGNKNQVAEDERIGILVSEFKKAKDSTNAKIKHTKDAFNDSEFKAEYTKIKDKTDE